MYTEEYRDELLDAIRILQNRVKELEDFVKETAHYKDNDCWCDCDPRWIDMTEHEPYCQKVRKMLGYTDG
jgi:hypothetical protein